MPPHGHLSLEEGGRKAVFCGQRRRRPPECTRWDQRGQSGAKGAQPLGGARNRPLPPEPLGCLGLGGTRLQPGGADFRLLGPRAVPPGNKFLLFSGTQFGVICYSHPRTLPDSAVLDVSSAQKLLGAHLWVRLLRMCPAGNVSLENSELPLKIEFKCLLFHGAFPDLPFSRQDHPLPHLTALV